MPSETSGGAKNGDASANTAEESTAVTDAADMPAEGTHAAESATEPASPASE